MEAHPSRRRRIVGVIVLLALALLVPTVHRHLLGASLLLRLGAVDQPDRGLATYGRGAFRTNERVLAGAHGSIRARDYRPNGTARGRLMLVHGMHFAGIDEPRLVELSKNFASLGVHVTTPEIDSLSDYTLDVSGIDRIEDAACALAADGEPIGVMGTSFAGGLTLLAARDPARRPCISFVVSVGAHQDLGRVARWFAGDPAPGPRGERVSTSPHPYGAQLLMHDDPSRFFPADDVQLARELLGLSLQGRWREARAAESGLTDDGRTTLELALHGGLDPRVAAPLRAMTYERAEELARLSPSASIGSRPVRAFLLHGTSDPIVPATEALWLSAQLGEDATTLVSSAIRHAEGATDADWKEKVRLVHFLASVFSAMA